MTAGVAIWDSVEAQAWAEDRDYAAYCVLLVITGCMGKPLSEMAYLLFCKALDADYEDDRAKVMAHGPQ